VHLKGIKPLLMHAANSIGQTSTKTCLEEAMSKILSSLNIDFQEQVSTRSGFVIDFAIYLDTTHTNKIAIETDGTNWHSSSKAKKT